MTTTTLLLLAIVIIMALAAPFILVMKDFLPAQIEKSANLEQNENRIYVLHSEVHEAQAQLANVTAHRNQRSAEIQRIESEARKAEKTIRELENQPPLFVHEVGEPRANLTRFVVNITLTKASGETRTAPVNPIWRCANVAEVWATSQEEAKQLVETVFPFKLGFNKSFARQPAPAKPAAAPSAAENAAAGNAAPADTPPAPSMLPASPGRELRRPAMTATAAEGAAEGAAPPPAETATPS